MLQDVDEETDKDTIVNEAFKSVVGERSGYCRGLGNGVKPTKGKSITGLHEQLASEREKRQSLEMKLKEVETQLQEERSMREELTTHVEESQRQFQEKIEKTVEERVASLSESQLKEIIDKQVQERLTSFFFSMQNFSGGGRGE
ncbi:hypothetical protein SESBI_42707 [Sesbania bispinosa]|nr:hypothetical protein SESBI_42707 [Sesbania bispinosa]